MIRWVGQYTGLESDRFFERFPEIRGLDLRVNLPCGTSKHHIATKAVVSHVTYYMYSRTCVCLFGYSTLLRDD